ncbi:MAG: acyl-CoA thioesterase [Ignavibacteriales bacterium]|jgi:acyl-CoA thioester hydrolase|nr:thioesterase family protein [Ignavibacteriaceae bacterium]NLH59795.1 acyl-CoA thioesterase [Ignavibacteriales bacterium]HOJ18372.1 thioesterase family protein [Ignavibacteriaceae bacterium]HPO56717.1 thioesterase family protein [Ignavibacteriaceae bacterium]
MEKGYKHKIELKVRFNEVDMLGVCNNAVYITYFEEARLEYTKEMGLIPEKGIFEDGNLYFMVHNEVNYRAHAHYGDELEIYSKISYIKNSSFGFDHLVVNKQSKEKIADGKGVIVYVDPVTRKSTRLPESFCEAVKHFEPSVQILRNEREG